jgi:glycosyltransferase involved in cell wall biosynthesis
MTDLASGLAKRGYTVNVFTGTRLRSNETIPDPYPEIEVTYSPAIFHHGHSIFSKIISSLSFIIGALFYITFRPSSDTPLFIASNPPYSGLLGIYFKCIKRGRFYFLLQDIFPESAVLSSIFSDNSFLFSVFSWVIERVCLQSTYTVVLTDAMKVFLERKYPDVQNLKKLRVIENWSIENIPILDKNNNSFACQYGLDQKFTILYSGNIGRLHDVESVVEAAKLLRDESFQFIFIGDGAKTPILKQAIQSYQLDNIVLLPFQPRALIPLSLTACDISLVSLIEGAENLVAPCKLYGMLSAGRAIVAISARDSYLDRLLTNYQCGVNCQPHRPQHLAKLLKTLASDTERVQNMAKNARELYEQKYTLDRALDQYNALFAEMKTSLDS